VTVAKGEKAAEAPGAGGNGATVKVMGFAKDPFDGATVKLKTAVCPASTVTKGTVTATV
jgi:hypothetical protein